MDPHLAAMRANAAHYAALNAEAARSRAAVVPPQAPAVARSEPVRPPPRPAVAVEEFPSERPGASAERLLKKILAAGPMAATAIEQAADRLGLNPRTLYRAKRRLGIKSKRVGHAWLWWLP